MDTNTAIAYLKFWGNYTRRNRTHYIGYPRRNIFDRILKEGFGANAPTTWEDNIPTDVVMIEKIYLTLGQKARDVIWATYVNRNGIVDGSKALNMSRERFRQALRGAEERVCGALTFFGDKDD